MTNGTIPDRRVGNPTGDSYHEQRIAKLEWRLRRGVRKYTCREDCDLAKNNCLRCWEEGRNTVDGCPCGVFPADQAKAIRASAERILAGVRDEENNVRELAAIGVR